MSEIKIADLKKSDFVSMTYSDSDTEETIFISRVLKCENGVVALTDLFSSNEWLIEEYWEVGDKEYYEYQILDVGDCPYKLFENVKKLYPELFI